MNILPKYLGIAGSQKGGLLAAIDYAFSCFVVVESFGNFGVPFVETFGILLGLGWAGLGWAGLGLGLGRAGLGWAGLGWAGLGWAATSSILGGEKARRLRGLRSSVPRRNLVVGSGAPRGASAGLLRRRALLLQVRQPMVAL